MREGKGERGVVGMKRKIKRRERVDGKVGLKGWVNWEG